MKCVCVCLCVCGGTHVHVRTCLDIVLFSLLLARLAHLLKMASITVSLSPHAHAHAHAHARTRTHTHTHCPCRVLVRSAYYYVHGVVGVGELVGGELGRVEKDEVVAVLAREMALETPFISALFPDLQKDLLKIDEVKVMHPPFILWFGFCIYLHVHVYYMYMYLANNTWPFSFRTPHPSLPFFPASPLPLPLSFQTFVKSHHKVGVLRIKNGQSTEEEIFANGHEPGTFNEFLNVLGENSCIPVLVLHTNLTQYYIHVWWPWRREILILPSYSSVTLYLANPL